MHSVRPIRSLKFLHGDDFCVIHTDIILQISYRDIVWVNLCLYVPTPYSMRHIQVFNKINRILKNVSNALGNKKGRLHFWRTAWFTYKCWFVVFALLLWILAENRVKLEKLFNFNGRLRWGAQNPRYTECSYYFLISNCSNSSEFLN